MEVMSELGLRMSRHSKGKGGEKEFNLNLILDFLYIFFSFRKPFESLL